MLLIILTQYATIRVITGIKVKQQIYEVNNLKIGSYFKLLSYLIVAMNHIKMGILYQRHKKLMSIMKYSWNIKIFIFFRIYTFDICFLCNIKHISPVL